MKFGQKAEFPARALSSFALHLLQTSLRDEVMLCKASRGRTPLPLTNTNGMQQSQGKKAA